MGSNVWHLYLKNIIVSLYCVIEAVLPMHCHLRHSIFIPANFLFMFPEGTAWCLSGRLRIRRLQSPTVYEVRFPVNIILKLVFSVCPEEVDRTFSC